MLSRHKISENAAYSKFASGKKGASEFIFLATSNPERPLAISLERLGADYKQFLRENQITSDSQIFCRLYLSEGNFADINGSELLASLQTGVLTIIRQTPVFGAVISLMAYHIAPMDSPLKIIKSTPAEGGAHQWLKADGAHYSMLWSVNHTDHSPSTENQTQAIFSGIQSVLRQNGFSLKENLLRTWIYVRNIEKNYLPMANARREFFFSQGYAPEDTFPASTGIEGAPIEPDAHLLADALAIAPLQPRQFLELKAPEHLSATMDYQITFARGIKIKFGDRGHLHISGTASIDTQGEVMFPGDIQSQTQRTLENISALLDSGGATFADMAFFLIYIKNAEDAEIVQQIFSNMVGHEAPCLMFVADVCRPAWLVEIEGVALTDEAFPFPPFL